MSIKQNLLKGFVSASLLAAVTSNPNTALAQSAQKPDSSQSGGISNFQPDPNFPEQAGVKAFGDLTVGWSIDVAGGYKAPTNITVRKGGQIFSGQYLGFQKHGSSVVSYLRVDGEGRVKIENGTATVIAKGDMPDEAHLVNTRHPDSGASTQVASAGSPPDKKPDLGGSGSRAFRGGSDNSAAATDLKVDATVPDATIVTKKTASGVYTITYTDPTTKSKVSVDAKRVFTSKEWEVYSQLSPAERITAAERMDVELTQRGLHPLGNFVKLMPNTGKVPKGPLTIYTFPDDGGALIIHASKENPTGIVIPPEDAAISH
jgi:hypothetical protein